jgi:hypothetical protein
MAGEPLSPPEHPRLSGIIRAGLTPSRLRRDGSLHLQEKQGEKYRLEITDLTGGETGTRVEIFIPEEN